MSEETSYPSLGDEGGHALEVELVCDNAKSGSACPISWKGGRTDGDTRGLSRAGDVQGADVLRVAGRLEGKDLDRRGVGSKHVEEAEIALHEHEQGATTT